MINKIRRMIIALAIVAGMIVVIAVIDWLFNTLLVICPIVVVVFLVICLGIWVYNIYKSLE